MTEADTFIFKMKESLIRAQVNDSSLEMQSKLLNIQFELPFLTNCGRKLQALLVDDKEQLFLRTEQ